MPISRETIVVYLRFHLKSGRRKTDSILCSLFYAKAVSDEHFFLFRVAYDVCGVCIYISLLHSRKGKIPVLKFKIYFQIFQQ